MQKPGTILALGSFPRQMPVRLHENGKGSGVAATLNPVALIVGFTGPHLARNQGTPVTEK
jgi:hypothetical protein